MSEQLRLKALTETGLLDSLPEERFDRLTRLAARSLGMETALISLIDEDRQWFKSRHCFGTEETPRDQAFCDHAIRAPDEVMVVYDASQDDRFADNPLVTSDNGIAFYAGAPLVTSDGHALGTLCVIDHKPHPDFSEEDRQTLADLAATVMTEIELAATQQTAADMAVVNAELKHRLGNTYAQVASLVSLIGQSESDKDLFIRRLRENITSLSQTQALLAARKWHDVMLSDVLESTLSPFQSMSDAPRITVALTKDHPISSRGAFILTLLIQELATNSFKHGALRDAAGAVSLSFDGDDPITLRWQETGGTPSAAADTPGFGSKILLKIAPGGLGGKAIFDLTEAGLIYEVSAQASKLLSARPA